MLPLRTIPRPTPPPPPPRPGKAESRHDMGHPQPDPLKLGNSSFRQAPEGQGHPHCPVPPLHAGMLPPGGGCLAPGPGRLHPQDCLPAPLDVLPVWTRPGVHLLVPLWAHLLVGRAAAPLCLGLRTLSFRHAAHTSGCSGAAKLAQPLCDTISSTVTSLVCAAGLGPRKTGRPG